MPVTIKKARVAFAACRNNRFVCPKRCVPALLVTTIIWFTLSSGRAATFSLPAQTAAGNKLDLGLFSGGAIITLQMSGAVDLGDTWSTWADGSLVSNITATGYTYANPGATNYPKASGGDGTNHFAGGGANYDTSSGSYGIAGAQTTDTSSPAAIRFGAVVGTFAGTPARSDWFYVGLSNSVTVPLGGARLFLAVSDAYSGNNAGSYSGNLQVRQSSPILVSISKPSGGQMTISWSTDSGQKYQLLYRTNAASTNWGTWGPVLTATNSSLSVQDSINPDAQRLYRVQLAQ
jgi:hypothetical protein